MIMRSALPEDAAALAALGRESFCAAFEHLYDPKDLSAFLQTAYAPSVIASDINNPAITYCVTEDTPRSGLTAYIKLCNPSEYAEHSDANSPLGLGQLYTAPDRTGEGLGAALMHWAVEQARTGQHDAIQLSVWSENTGAQRFYQRYGFAKIADVSFWVGNHRDDEFLYEMRL